MNLVRSIISVFLIALLGISIAGWIWAGGQPTPKMQGSRVVLAICGFASTGCLLLLWSAKPGRPSQQHPSPADGT
ncbi:hypothetical protein FYK55_12765 [Roseiconus nitratireducens]|uniref:Uncharacterized protein n=1 Tax=Roseiconus nitratireducens TaxID=2605748 RepID=A0A5M6DAV6_9BACT|nr:hypothetical protein [Roseiconus nitratireducens]KAA5543149.1 hypothetical protein FYK55_12765 [Roseiconus nitratireducens]